MQQMLGVVAQGDWRGSGGLSGGWSSSGELLRVGLRRSGDLAALEQSGLLVPSLWFGWLAWLCS